MPKSKDPGEEDLLVELSKAVTTAIIAQLANGEASPQEIANAIRHLKANDISYEMMKNEEEQEKTLTLLDDIKITKDSDEGLDYLKEG